MDSTGKTFTTNLKRLRAQERLTQDALSERLGVTTQTVRNYESGLRWPDPDVIDRLADALGVGAWELFRPDGAEPTPTVIEPSAEQMIEAAAERGAEKVLARFKAAQVPKEGPRYSDKLPTMLVDDRGLPLTSQIPIMHRLIAELLELEKAGERGVVSQVVNAAHAKLRDLTSPPAEQAQTSKKSTG